ncbi:MAG: serine/threonine-protein kinase [Planctomycetota bacterium]
MGNDEHPLTSSPTADLSADAARGVGGGVGEGGVVGEGPGSRIGAYRILRHIGEGGFGSVFLAQQERPVERKVALKIIKLGMDTRQVIARFEQERQALAILDHPNIAKVFDAGATDTGRAYFVMELCAGEPIDTYCDRNLLGIPGRLGLFGQICSAVQHAHTKGLIHRDIKPSNILVSSHDGRPSVKVIDFGIAKATGAKLTERTLVTRDNQMIGTPQYMSPEQAEGSPDIDTRTDIFSLGVLLYELLTGSTPFSGDELRSAAHAEIQRIIREVDPPRPSTRLDSNLDAATHAAACRATKPALLTGLLRRDLDWVVMKCLEKDRTRRYESASALGADLERYLQNKPVLAGPPTLGYVVSKFLRRHRVGVVTGCAAVLVLVVATAVSVTSAVIARGALEAERQRAAQLESVSAFQADQLGELDPVSFGLLLRERVLAAAGPERAALVGESLVGINFTDVAKEALNEGIFRRSIAVIDERFADQPKVRAQLLHTIARTLLDLGLLEQAVDPLQRALAMRRSELGDDDRQTLSSLSTLGRLMRARGELDEALKLHTEALERRTRALGARDEDTLYSANDLGYLHLKRGELDAAWTPLAAALEGRRATLGNEHHSTLISVLNMGEWHLAKGDVAKAQEHFQMSADGSRRALGPTHPSTLHAVNNLGLSYAMQKKFDEAGTCWSECLAGYRTRLGSDHPSTLVAMHNLAKLLLVTRAFARCETLAIESEQRNRARYKSTSRHVGEAVDMLVKLYTAWNEDEPGKGYDVRAAEWKERGGK